MKKTPDSKLKKKYESVCNEYIKKFSKKQGIEFDYWIGDEIGGIASFISQYFFNFHDIVWDINSEQPADLILKWQDECVENAKTSLNYFSYSKGLRFTDLE